MENGGSNIKIDNVDYGPHVCIQADQAREITVKSLESDIFKKFRGYILTITSPRKTKFNNGLLEDTLTIEEQLCHALGLLTYS